MIVEHKTADRPIPARCAVRRIERGDGNGGMP